MILLTGAAGFIGSHLAERLLALGEEVVGLDNFDAYYPRAAKERNLAAARRHAAFRLVEGDVRDAALLGELFAGKRFGAVVHLAARAGVRASLQDPAGYADVNVRGTAVLLEAARNAGVRRFVLASSSSVYGLSTPAPFREDAPCDRPASPYAASKHAMELLARAAHEAWGLDVACLRYFSVYGPRQRPDMAAHKFARLLLAGEKLPLFGDPDSARDYTYVDDIVDGTVRALQRARGFGVYNLGGGCVVKLGRLVAELEQAAGRKATVEARGSQPGDVPLTSADLERSRRELGYNPSTPLGEGLARFIEWLRGEGAEG